MYLIKKMELEIYIPQIIVDKNKSDNFTHETFKQYFANNFFFLLIST